MSEPEVQTFECDACGSEIGENDSIACSKCGQSACINCADTDNLCPDCAPMESGESHPDDARDDDLDGSVENAEENAEAGQDGLFPGGVEEEEEQGPSPPEPPQESVASIKSRLQEALKGTATPFWRRFYQWVIAELDTACAALQTEEKSKEITRLQARIAVAKEIMTFAREPASFFNELRQDHPVLCSDVKDGFASFDDETGIVSFVPRTKGAD